MTTASYPPFPDLATIAFRNSDTSDHNGGGHCAGLPDGPLHGQWDLVLDQHLAALEHLVDKAVTEEGWALTRPVLFAAHHVCEVALKTAWALRTGTEPRRGHHLRPHWDRLGRAHHLSHLSPAEANEAQAFLDLMTELTPDGQTTRYPLPDGNDIAAEWCCLNSAGLHDAVRAFVARLDLV